jgi:CRISPR system Cascade subunit CasB
MSEDKRELPDFEDFWRRYKLLKPGAKAELRRVTEPDELREQPALYRLLPGAKAPQWALCALFLMPWLAESGPPQPLAKALVGAKISDRRLYQVVRADWPNDLIQLRRLVQQAQPAPDWKSLGWTLLKWSIETKRAEAKRELVEAFFIAATAKPKTATAGATS